MTPHKQLFRHDPDNEIYGDCHRTAIACILDLRPEDVPHVFSGDKLASSSMAEMDAFLSDRFELRQAIFPYPGTLQMSDILESMEMLNEGLHFILGGTSRNGTGHSVVCSGGVIAHDPSLDDSGIVGPMSDGLWWVTVLTKDTRKARTDV